MSVSASIAIIANWPYGGCFDSALFAIRAIFDNKADCFLDADPVEFFCDSGGGFVDASVLGSVHIPSDFVLSLRVTYYLFIFQHKPLALSAFIGQ